MENTDFGALKIAPAESSTSNNSKSLINEVRDSSRSISNSDTNHPGKTPLEHLPVLLVDARNSAKSAQDLGRQTSKKTERVLSVDDVDDKIGWWQQKEYQKLGVERIRLGDDTVSIELKKPTTKNAIVTTLEMDKTFSFRFEKSRWALSRVEGLKIEGTPVSAVEIANNKITFTTEGGAKRTYGKAASEFIKALLDPLMSENLRR